MPFNSLPTSQCDHVHVRARQCAPLKPTRRGGGGYPPPESQISWCSEQVHVATENNSTGSIRYCDSCGSKVETHDATLPDHGRSACRGLRRKRCCRHRRRRRLRGRRKRSPGRPRTQFCLLRNPPRRTRVPSVLIGRLYTARGLVPCNRDQHFIMREGFIFCERGFMPPPSLPCRRVRSTRP